MRVLTKRALRLLGRLLYRTDETGHSLLCRLLSSIAHDGPHGTFVRLDHLKLKAGGFLCSFGVECGDPSDSYMQHLDEVSDQFRRLQRILEANGALESMLWENPRFSPAALCECGKQDARELPLHDPVCPYRVEHDYPVTIEEYRQGLEGRAFTC